MDDQDYVQAQEHALSRTTCTLRKFIAIPSVGAIETEDFIAASLHIRVVAEIRGYRTSSAPAIPALRSFSQRPISFPIFSRSFSVPTDQERAPAYARSGRDSSAAAAKFENRPLMRSTGACSMYVVTVALKKYSSSLAVQSVRSGIL